MRIARKSPHALREHQVIIVCGETGSGKSTQLPKICLEMGRGVDGMIGHTQPRRLAARSIATRLAEELGSPLGQDVGYKIRFTDRTRPETYVKLMTDGILLAETPRDRFLNQYDTIILDEAHERSLNIDFLLGYLKRLLPKRPELRCIITSATIDAERFSEHFRDRARAGAGHRSLRTQLSGRSPLPAGRSRTKRVRSRSWPTGSWRRWTSWYASTGGDILVFLPTERDIRETAAVLHRHAQHRRRPLEVLPLYARLPAKEQNRVFAAHHTSARRAGHERGRIVADRAGHPRGGRHGHGAHQPLLAALQGAATADRIGVASVGRSAQRAVRSRSGRESASGSTAKTTTWLATRTRRRRFAAPIWRR